MKRLLILIMMIGLILGIVEVSRAGSVASQVVGFQVRRPKEISVSTSTTAAEKPKEITAKVSDGADLPIDGSKIIAGGLKITRTALDSSEAGYSAEQAGVAALTLTGA